MGKKDIAFRCCGNSDCNHLGCVHQSWENTRGQKPHRDVVYVCDLYRRCSCWENGKFVCRFCDSSLPSKVAMRDPRSYTNNCGEDYWDEVPGLPADDHEEFNRDLEECRAGTCPGKWEHVTG